jgi:hypothetical protein
MEREIDAELGHGHILGIEQLALQTGIGLADQKLPAGSDDPVPGDASSGRSGGHGVTGCASAAAKTQDPR